MSHQITKHFSGPLMIGIESTELTENDINRLNHPQVGGVILFSRNYQSKLQITELCKKIHSLRSDLIIGIDQEGGRVQRLKGDGFSHLQSLYSIGSRYFENPKETIDAIIEHARVMAIELQSCDIDLCFAPVVDLYHKDSPVIGERALSSDPEVVIELSSYYINTMKDIGLIPVIKHFPGHGFSLVDSHNETVTDHRSLALIEETDLSPFLYHIKKNHVDLMVSHLLVDQVDQTITSFSKVWLKTYLRETYHFNGLIFSDDLGMQAAINATGNRFLCIESSLNNGCDIAIIGNDFDMIDHYLLNHS